MSTARTPEQNNVVKRRNHTLVEAARTMLSAAKVPLFFWAEAIATTCFTQNYHVSSDPAPKCLTTTLEQDSLSPGPQSQENVPYAAKTVTTSNELDLLFSLMFDELLNGTTLVVSKSFAVHAVDAPNKRQQQNITPSTSTTIAADSPPLNIQTTPETTSQAPTVTTTENINQAETYKETAQVEEEKFINIFSTPIHEQGETSYRYVDSTRRQLETYGEMCMFALTVSRTKPENIKEDMADSAWIEAIREEIHQFKQLDVWKLVDRPLCKNVINMKWLWKNKRDEENTVIRNKACLVAKGYDGFIDPHHLEKVYCLKMALYGHKQPPRAWYDELSNFLVSKGFSKGSIDLTFFITKKGEDILLVQICVEDIIFGSTNPKPSKKFEKLMHNKFEMSMMRELKFFLGIQIHQSPSGIFINQAKYAQEILKKHGMTSCDSIALKYLTASRPDIVHATCYCARYQARPTKKHLKEVKRIFWYLKNTINMGLWYSKDTGFELTAFSDLDYAGCLNTRKSTSVVKAEYVSLSTCCAQVLWLRTQLTDYGFHFDKIPLYYDLQAAIAILCNLVQHSRTKHIDVRYHFIKDHVENGIVELFFVGTEYQLADLFTKALSEDRFKYLVKRLGMRCLTPEELKVLANEFA
ncbi:retrovirus-related pol polyprotein from transposon TNT 1-94 [Tanacetum coccineum]